MLTVFNNNDYETWISCCSQQTSPEEPELESVGVFLNRPHCNTSNRPLAAAFLGRYGLYSLCMNKSRFNNRFNITVFLLFVKVVSIKLLLYFVDFQYIINSRESSKSFIIPIEINFDI